MVNTDIHPSHNVSDATIGGIYIAECIACEGLYSEGSLEEPCTRGRQQLAHADTDEKNPPQGGSFRGDAWAS